MSQHAGAGEELSSKIRRWAENAGYALELRVARALLHEAQLVQLAEQYWDTAGRRWREADVIAYLSALGHPRIRLQVVVECKSGKTYPWVVFTDPHRTMDEATAYERALRVGQTEHDARAVWKNGRGTEALPVGAAGYSIVEAHVGDKQPPADKDENEARVPYRAVRQAVNAAVHVVERTPAMPPGHFVQFTVPVVVTGARIFECSLGKAGDVDVVETSASSLYVQPDASNAVPRLVHVIREDHLPQFVRQLRRSLEAMSTQPAAQQAEASAFDS